MKNSALNLVSLIHTEVSSLTYFSHLGDNFVMDGHPAGECRELLKIFEIALECLAVSVGRTWNS